MPDHRRRVEKTMNHAMPLAPTGPGLPPTEEKTSLVSLASLYSPAPSSVSGLSSVLGMAKTRPFGPGDPGGRGNNKF